MAALRNGVRREEIKLRNRDFDSVGRRRRERWSKSGKIRRDEKLWRRRFQLDPGLKRRLTREILFSANALSVLQCTNYIRRLMSQPPQYFLHNIVVINFMIDQVVSLNIVPRFVHFLSLNDSPGLQKEAAWALTNISSGTSQNIQKVIDSGAISEFVKLVGSERDELAELAAWALGNVVGDSPAFRDIVLDNEAFIPLLNRMNKFTNRAVLRRVARTVCCLCRGSPRLSRDQRIYAAQNLGQILDIKNDDGIVTDVCWALSYLADGTNYNIQPVLEHGSCGRLIQLLRHQSPTVLIPALRTIGNIVSGDELHTQPIIDLKALPNLKCLLTGNHKDSIKKEVCWIISNINAGNCTQIQSVMDAGVITDLINILSSTAAFEIKKEAAWAISTATFAAMDTQIMHLVSLGCVKQLCGYLTCFGRQGDVRSVTICLEALQIILERVRKINPKQLTDLKLTSRELQVIKKFLDLKNTEIAAKVKKLKLIWES